MKMIIAAGRTLTLVDFFLALMIATLTGRAQLAVRTSTPDATGQKAVVRLKLMNKFDTAIESARATVFLFDRQGDLVGQASQWVIGGTKDRPPLASGKEGTFNFVVPVTKAFKDQRITFTRLVLEGGKSVDPSKNVHIIQGEAEP